MYIWGHVSALIRSHVIGLQCFMKQQNKEQNNTPNPKTIAAAMQLKQLQLYKLTRAATLL